MKNVTEQDHLKALPLCVAVRTAKGTFRSRDESAQWSENGTSNAVSWHAEDFPAEVVWDYAQHIGDPKVEALAQLAQAMLAQQQQEAARQAVEQERMRQQFVQQQAPLEGSPQG